MGQAIGFVSLNVAVDHSLQIAVKHGVKVVRLVVRAMIDDTVLREIVGADSFGTIQRTHLGVTHVCGLCGFLLVLHGEQAALQHAQCGRTILDLALLILHAHHDASRNVGHTNCGICGIHGLAARARAHEDVDFQIFLIDFDLIVIFIGFREYNDARCGRLNTAL